VAGLIDEIGIVEIINQRLGIDPREKVSTGVIEITYGYSRDHRPDLKQFMMNLICVGDGDIRVLMEIASGNQSDKTRFAGLFQEFSKQWTFNGLCVADGALYSADNITAMTGLKWLTRVPLSISAAATLVDEVVELTDSGIKGYALKESSSEYAGVEQRWFLIESEQRRKSDFKQLTKRIERQRQKSQQELNQLCAIEFACIADATAAAQKLSQQITWHQLTEIETVEKKHYDKPGKPKPDAIPSRISFRVTATVVAIDSELTAQRVRLGKPTSSPTLRWVFQCFMAVHLVVFQGVQQVVNLTDERKHILRFFSDACRRYYLLPDTAS
jgi:hypothetical protein